jgi:hypothetical protein
MEAAAPLPSVACRDAPPDVPADETLEPTGEEPTDEEREAGDPPPQAPRTRADSTAEPPAAARRLKFTSLG